MARPRIVIVGAGFPGFHAARRLARVSRGTADDGRLGRVSPGLRVATRLALTDAPAASLRAASTAGTLQRRPQPVLACCGHLHPIGEPLTDPSHGQLKGEPTP
jgi:hypothetical protein